jgi:hypothetical protein
MMQGVGEWVLSDNISGANHFCISFDLDSLEDAPAWGNPGECRLHWFGLTSGRFWIETSSGRLLEYTAAIQESWSLPGLHPDYFVARLFEDLASMLPAILESVPADIAARVADPDWRATGELWSESAEDEQRWEPWYAATRWWYNRSLDMGYLKHAPRLTFWRVEETLFFQWKADNKENGVPVWTLPEGQISIAVSTFEAAAVQFCEEILDIMERRVGSIQQDGWKRTDCTLDVDGLVHEQTARRQFFQKMRHEKQATDWHKVRASLDAVIALMERPIPK